MDDPAPLLAAIRRPRLLLSAAQHVCLNYNRSRDLPRLLGLLSPRDMAGCLQALVGAEQTMETKRKTGDATYSITRHIQLLAALISEARLTSAAAHDDG
ncbi:hypothetical protein PSA7680_00645 [Pseudoruegeria aquimaris]|uniref:Uncharacterized protein n=1 Tax=Pseudoruegeria aquimaris TaxID=393663 RepID=A0A1Y5RIN7_9RHOB|nr:DUF6477 family protein [Pseudoruegeria aquimaris]SLN18546.1 hypothetical protein PSA7680_00645 [Pseudoruegeria aquimaris]